MESKLKEKDLENLVLDYLNRSGVFAFKVNTVGVWDSKQNIYRSLSKFVLKGTSDILGVLPNGRFLAIEMKTKTGVASKEQTAFINRVNKSGGLAFIARGIPDVKEKLDGLDRGKRELS